MDNKIMLHALKEDREKVMDFYKGWLERSKFTPAQREEFITSMGEVMDAICAADKEGGSLTCSFTEDEQGCGAQFMHLGPIFVPCANDGSSCPYTKEHMDETSYEFKYGRNAQYIFKLYEGGKTKYRLL